MDSKVTHADLVAFADDKVNIKRDDLKDYRNQVRKVRERLETYINDHPDFDLVKMLHSGSVAKGTALKTLNDMDVAVYVKAGKSPSDEAKLLEWLCARLRDAYVGWMKKEQINVQHHCVNMDFRTLELSLDVVPVLYEGGADDRGYLIPKDTGKRVLTSIPLHLEFIQKRKKAHKTHYRQMVRFVKWWKAEQVKSRAGFGFKSFMTELILAKLFDDGFDASDYADAMTEFFSYVVRTELKERIVFTDYYKASDVVASSAPIQIFDPVNPANNVASKYDDAARQMMVNAAEDALDAIAFARRATTKGDALAQWQKVLGPSFRGA